MAVSHAVDTPINKVPTVTPNTSKAEFARYSGSTVCLRCSQFSPEGSNTKPAMVNTGMLSNSATRMMPGCHSLSIEIRKIFPLLIIFINPVS
jgi:hypothetical protein